MVKNIWQLQEAKSRFSQLVESVLASGAQIVTRHGKKVAVVIPYEEYERLTSRKGTLSNFLLESPLAGTELNIERGTSLPSESEIEP